MNERIYMGSFGMLVSSESTRIGKSNPYTTVEHACIEVDAGVPLVEGELPLLVDIGLVRVVVRAGHRLPVLAGEEGVLLRYEVVPDTVGLPAEDHAELPPGCGLVHVLVAFLDLTVIVVVERLAELAP